MKRLVLLLALASLGALLVQPGTSQAEPRGPRTVRHGYVGFGGTTAATYPVIFAQEQFRGEAIGGTFIEGRKGETRFLARIEDATGLPVAARVLYVKPGQKEFSDLLLCEAMANPVSFRRDRPLHVVPVAGVCDADSPSIPTRGTITVEFGRRS